MEAVLSLLLTLMLALGPGLLAYRCARKRVAWGCLVPPLAWLGLCLCRMVELHSDSDRGCGLAAGIIVLAFIYGLWMLVSTAVAIAMGRSQASTAEAEPGTGLTTQC